MPDLEALWPAVLDRVRGVEGGAMLAALLEESRPVSLQDGQLSVAYPQSAAFNKRKVEDPANRDRVAEALRLVTGQPLELQFELGGQGGGGGQPEPALGEEELIERIKDVFGAEDVVERKPEGA
jgi:hypothetical protein